MFKPKWTEEAAKTFRTLEEAALAARNKRYDKNKAKSSQQEGLFIQVHKTIKFLLQNPRHPSLNTHDFSSLRHPYDQTKKVFEAYGQNKTPGAYRVFWCYGPNQDHITIIAITPQP